VSEAVMGVLDAAEAVLEQAGEPLHVEELTRRILDAALWRTAGKTPKASIGSALAVDIKDRGLASRFQRAGRGLIALRAWGLPEYFTSIEGTRAAPAFGHGLDGPRPILLTLKDAAEVVLERYAGKRPMNYRDVTQKALELGLFTTPRVYAASNLLMEVVTDIARQAERGQQSRFTKPGKGLIGLSSWAEEESVSQA
jgi:restriction system protein